MPVFSAFTGFGFLDFADEPSECEKVYNALCVGYRDPSTGKPTIDLSPGTHQEAKIYAWACAIAAARVTLRGAGNELRPETSYCLLESQEEKFGMSPAAGDSVAVRQAALAAKLGIAPDARILVGGSTQLGRGEEQPLVRQTLRDQRIARGVELLEHERHLGREAGESHR